MANPYTPQEWLRISMQQQGLLQPNVHVANIINTLSYVQIDSINVVERAHHHVLHNRISQYTPSMLDAALAEKSIFEYWSHAAAYLPMSDYRYSLYHKHKLQNGAKHWHEPQYKDMQKVKQRISNEGPLKASQFKQNNSAKHTGWWDWKPAKKALEQLFMHGELMVVKRVKFQKVYDLTERVLPSDVNTRLPNDDEYARHLINKYLQAHGFASAQQISYLRKGLKPLITQTLRDMSEADEIAQFTENKQAYYFLDKLELPSMGDEKVHLLNPFDNLVIQRQKLKMWFKFDYQIEVYIPEAKRQYGYYSLLILYRDQFIGRVDVKADRKNSCLLLQNLVFEYSAFQANTCNKIKNNLRCAEPIDKEEFIAEFVTSLNEYRVFNQCEHCRLIKCNDPTIYALLTNSELIN